MGNMRVVTYTKDEKEIVEAGILAIQNVLFGENMDRKRSLLFCHDWYMDPYYGHDISSIHNELVNLLQEVIIAHNYIDVKEDALQLLRNYTYGPYRILEEKQEDVEKELLPDVLYLINS